MTAISFENQIDFILFFYGLAFCLLGLVALTIARGAGEAPMWFALGLFGLVHGAAEWLDLVALIVSDGPAFAIFRLVVMTISFLTLLEAARIGALGRHWKAPGRWVYGPLLSIILATGLQLGLPAANALARYSLGLVGSCGVGAVLIGYALSKSGGERRVRTAAERRWPLAAERGWALAAAAGFLLYGVAAGGIAPAAPIWPATWLNQTAFITLTGLPIQLVRGVLACGITLSVWGIWGKRVTHQVGSAHYTRYWKHQFSWTFGGVISIILCGWVLTEYLGGIYGESVEQEGRGELAMMSSLLAAEQAPIEGVAKALAGSRTIAAALGDPAGDDRRAEAVLRSDVEAAGAQQGIVLNKAGIVVLSLERRHVGLDIARELGSDDAGAALFREAMAGRIGHALSFDPVSGERNYRVSIAIRGSSGVGVASGFGDIIGVAVLTKSLAAFEAVIREFGPPMFLVDRNGLVMLTNRPTQMLRPLWPIPDTVRSGLDPHFTRLGEAPLIAKEIVDATWVSVDNERDFTRRAAIEHTDWSLILLIRPRGIGASRALGIIITLLAAAVTLVYLIGRERRVHDMVQAGKRLELEELARELDRQASTDVLTGANNRAKFDQELETQIARAQRHELALSVILYDVDHFKRVNDGFGHLAGDAVLARISHLSRQKIRNTDVHARWGGEEFVVLAPDATSAMASQLAEHLRCAIEDCVFADVGTVTCSFGVAQFQPGDTAATLVARADAMLYQAKTNGRNRVEEAFGVGETAGPLVDAAVAARLGSLERT